MNGLARTLSHPTDQRMLLVGATQEGLNRVEHLRPELHQSEKRWVGCLNLDERLTLLSLVARLQANAQQV